MARKSSNEPKLPTQRQMRAGEVIRHALSDIMARREMRDPVLQNAIISVTEVKPNNDLRSCKVYVAPLGDGDATELAKALNRCAGFLRGKLGREIELKFTPELHFHADNSFAIASHVDSILARPEVQRDLARDEADDDEQG